MDSLGNPLEEGKYYQLDFQPRVQYTGVSDSGSVFNFKPPGRRVVVRTPQRLIDFPPVRLGDEAGDETDGEYENPIDNKLNNNIYASDSDTDDEDLVLDPIGGKRRRKKTRRHRKKTRKHRRKTRKHRKKSRKHRKR
jgi:hypothetical protein